MLFPFFLLEEPLLLPLRCRCALLLVAVVAVAWLLALRADCEPCTLLLPAPSLVFPAGAAQMHLFELLVHQQRACS